MISKKTSQILDIEIKTSPAKLLLVLLPHLVIAVILLLALEKEGLTLFYLSISIIILFISLIYFIRLHLNLRSKKSIKSLRITDKTNWIVTQIGGEEVRVTISSTTFVSNWLVILNMISASQKQYSIVICADSVSDEEFRILKVILNSKKSVESSS